MKVWDSAFQNFDCLKSVAVTLYQNLLLYNLAILSITFFMYNCKISRHEGVNSAPKWFSKQPSKFPVYMSDIYHPWSSNKILTDCKMCLLYSPWFYVLRIKSYKLYYFCFITVIVTFLVCIWRVNSNRFLNCTI